MSGKKPDKEKLQSKVPSRGRTLGSISVANMVNTADAQMFPTLFPQIEPSLRLTAAQLGLIPTIRLVLQSTTAPLWGWWSDKHSRRRILSTGCFLWALFTIFTGLATQYMDILLWRALTGIGLAVIVPTTQSIAADYFLA